MPLTPEKLNEVLPDIVRRLRAKFDPCTIYLFGSCAYDRAGPDSDVDVLVVVPESSETFFERGARAYRALGRIGVPVDVLVYTRPEFESRSALPVSFERTIREKGRVIHAA